jgi:hypothetical protein
MTSIEMYEVRTDVTVGNETFPHVVAREVQESRAITVADRDTLKHGRSYYVVRVSEVRVYTTELAE